MSFYGEELATPPNCALMMAAAAPGASHFGACAAAYPQGSGSLYPQDCTGPCPPPGSWPCAQGSGSGAQGSASSAQSSAPCDQGSEPCGEGQAISQVHDSQAHVAARSQCLVDSLDQTNNAQAYSQQFCAGPEPPHTRAPADAPDRAQVALAHAYAHFNAADAQAHTQPLAQTPIQSEVDNERVNNNRAQPPPTLAQPPPASAPAPGPAAAAAALCMVCGDDGAKSHYGALSCLGCKGFFRRALKKANEYECLRNGDCLINKYERNSCRACRLQKCLAAGMDPAAVRPDRDFTGKQRQSFRLTTAFQRRGSRSSGRKRTPPPSAQTSPQQRAAIVDEATKTAVFVAVAAAAAATTAADAVETASSTSLGADVRMPPMRKEATTMPQQQHQQQQQQQQQQHKATARIEHQDESSSEWAKRLPVEMRTMLMNLLNIEAKVVRGDTMKDASDIYPLGINTIREIIDEPIKLRGRRTVMRYEPYRMARNEELSVIVYRRLIAAVDWVAQLAEMMDGGLSTDDRIALVKSAFGPLMLFKCSAKTATVTDDNNLLCLCNFAYVPRNIAKAYSDTYHLDNGLVDRLLNELVLPFRRIHLQEEEIVCLSAIIVLNPMAKDLSEAAIAKVNRLRDRINDTLYQIVKESRRQDTPAPAPHFGNLLLYLPIVTGCANAMNENLRFAQTFSAQGAIPLLTSLFGCFPVEPFLESEFTLAASITDTAATAAVDNHSNGNSGSSSANTAAVEAKGNVLCKNVEVQTDDDDSGATNTQQHGTKRRLPAYFTSPVEDDSVHDFRLLHAPCSYTLTEMFDDCANDCADSPTPTPSHKSSHSQSHSKNSSHSLSHSKNSSHSQIAGGQMSLAPTASLPALALNDEAASGGKAPQRSAVARLSSWSDTAAAAKSSASSSSCDAFLQPSNNRRQTLHSTYYSGDAQQPKASAAAAATAAAAVETVVPPLRAVLSTSALTHTWQPTLLRSTNSEERTTNTAAPQNMVYLEQPVFELPGADLSSSQNSSSCAAASMQWYPTDTTGYLNTTAAATATTTATATAAATVHHEQLLPNDGGCGAALIQWYQPTRTTVLYPQTAAPTAAATAAATANTAATVPTVVPSSSFQYAAARNPPTNLNENLPNFAQFYPPYYHNMYNLSYDQLATVPSTTVAAQAFWCPNSQYQNSHYPQHFQQQQQLTQNLPSMQQQQLEQQQQQRLEQQQQYLAAPSRSEFPQVMVFAQLQQQQPQQQQ